MIEGLVTRLRSFVSTASTRRIAWARSFSRIIQLRMPAVMCLQVTFTRQFGFTVRRVSTSGCRVSYSAAMWEFFPRSVTLPDWEM
jgi:hypothetical protein